MNTDIKPETTTSKIATLLVLSSVLAIGIGQSMTFALLAPLGREIGLKELQIGVIISGSAITYTMMSPIWGRTCDRVGRKPILILGLIGYVGGCSAFATMFLLGFKGYLSGLVLFTAIIVSRVLMASLMSAAPSAAAGYIADTTSKEQRVAGMGRLGAARTLGAIMGPALSGILVIFGLLAPLYIAAAITLVTLIIITIILKEPKHSPHQSIKTKKLQWLDSRYRAYVLTGFFTFIAFSMMSQTIGFYFQDRFVLDAQKTAQVVGTGMMISALMSLFSQSVLVGRLGMKPQQLIYCGLPLLGTGFALLPFVSNMILVFTILGVQGLGLGLIAPAFTGGASLAVSSDEQGAIGGIISSCPAAGFVLGPIIGTSLYQLAQPLPYLCACVLMIILLIYLRCFGFRGHN